MPVSGNKESLGLCKFVHLRLNYKAVLHISLASVFNIQILGLTVTWIKISGLKDRRICILASSLNDSYTLEIVIATLQSEMTMVHFCYHIIIREFKVGFVYLSRTDVQRILKSVFPNAKDQELMKLQNCQTSLMFTLAYSKFQLTYWPPSQYQNEESL